MIEPSEFNRGVIEEFRSSGGKVGGPFDGATILLLTTTGAKTGRRGTTPLVYSRDGDKLVIMASKAGAPTNPAWYHNLSANPTVTVEVGTESFDARAETVTGTERERLFAQHAEKNPGFLDYQKKTSRVIPVVRLTRLN